MTYLWQPALVYHPAPWWTSDLIAWLVPALALIVPSLAMLVLNVSMGARNDRTQQPNRPTYRRCKWTREQSIKAWKEGRYP